MKNIRCFGAILPIVTLCSGTGAYAQVASAQTSPSSGDAREEDHGSDASLADIVVTAQKRSERLSDVPMSITASSAEQLKDLGVTSTDDLGKLVPGFTFLQGNYGLPVYFIRGIGFSDTTLGVSPAVTVYVDQTPLPFSPMSRGATLDLERVEVLKGPQGTLFGQNSTGGAINYIAAKPTDHLAAGFDLTAGRFDQVDVEGFVSGPVTDTLKVRVAVRREYRGDWQRDYVNGDTIGKKNFLNGRAIIDWKPSESVKLSFSATGWRDKSDVQQEQFQLFRGQNPSDPNPRPVPFPISTYPKAPDNARAASWDPGFNFAKNDSFYQFALRGDVDLSDRVQLTNIASYARFETHIPLDLDGTIYPAARNSTDGTIKSFSEEIRLAGRFGSRLRWMVGGNYQKDKVDESIRLNPQIATEVKIGPFYYNDFIATNLQNIETKSGFGSLDFDLTDRLTLQGSLRYSDQDRKFRGCTRDGGEGDLAAAVSFLSSLITGQTQTIAPGACVTLSDQTGLAVPIVTGQLNEDNLSWRGSANYKFSNHALVYANITKGYKAGSFPTLPAAAVSQLAPVKQESVLAYEVGTKVDMFDRKLELTAAAFYYDYRDKQLVGTRAVFPFGFLPGLVSIPKSKVEGVELGFRAAPFRGLTIDGGGTYLKTKVLSDPVNPTGPFGSQGSFIGNSFPFTPKWQGVVNATYRFALSSQIDAFFGGSATSRSKTTAALFNGDATIAPLEQLLIIKGYTLLDLRAGIETSDGALRFEIWGRNVTNKYYATNANRISDYVYRFAGMPATYGATLRYRFGQ
ncbi:MAG TPA: TonB-dependent receptor [Sphingobium sp.]|uniref:TonB-dependent receptor n=1 Tax=Sphingobium sp. TaxID=1912891 RepID=UPI002ED03028